MNSNLSLRSRLQQLSTAELAASLLNLAKDDRATLVGYLWRLAEADARKDFLRSEHASLFAFCTRELRLSNSDAGRRIAAARLLAKFPGAEPYLADGRLNLSSFLPLKEILTPANAEDILARAAGLTADEVEILVATIRPRPDVPESFRAAPSRKETTAPVEVDLFANVSHRPAVERLSSTPNPDPVPALQPNASVPPVPVLLPRKPARARFEPLSADRIFLKLTVNRDFKTLINKVKDLLSHKLPNASYEEVIEECARRTLEQLERQKFGALSPRNRKKSQSTTRSEMTPREATTPNLGVTPSESTTPNLGVTPTDRTTPNLGVTLSDSSTPNLGVTSADSTTPNLGVTHSDRTTPNLGVTLSDSTTPNLGVGIRDDETIPRPVKRAVCLRDKGCCAFVAENGRRCGSTYQLEFHHDLARAHGGPPTVENIFLYCRAHNQLRARQDFGDEFMARFSGQ